MLRRSRRQRTATRFALIALTLAGSPGCQRSIVQQVDAAPANWSGEPVPASRVAPAVPQTAARVEPALAAPTALAAVLPVSLPGPATTAAPAPTPTLDAIAGRAEVLKHAALESLNEPVQKPAPKPVPAEPAPAPPAAEPAKPADPAPAAELPILHETGSTTAAHKPIDPDRPTPPEKPRDPWRDGLDRLRTLAHEHASTSSSAGEDWAVRARLLDWMSGVDEVDEASPLWQTILSALATTTAPGPSDDHERARAVRSAIEALEDQAPLEITDLRLCRKVNGFGNFESIDSASCLPGKPVIVYCELSGVRYESSGENFRSRLASQVDILTAKGDRTVWSHPLGTVEDLCPRRRRDYYVPYRINLPRSLARGNYKLRLTQKDLMTDRTSSQTIPLAIGR